MLQNAAETICPRTQATTSNLVDVLKRLKETPFLQVFVAGCAAVAVALAGTGSARAQTGSVAAASDAGSGQIAAGLMQGPPPSNVGVFPLNQVHRGLKGTAWTVFEGTVPEAMEVEILGVLHGARGPGRDMILARLHGAKPEYTGVVAGMSGSPVYVDGKLLGSLSYRIGQFSKEAIAGITPIEQMLEVRDLPHLGSTLIAEKETGEGSTFSAMETPLLMSGFQPEAIRVWKDRMAGTGLEMVSAGGGAVGGHAEKADASADEAAPIVPGSAVSLQLVRGDLEIAATCTVTYVDPKQLLACGHPVLQAGPVSLPMTTAEVVATLPSPLNAFKIINTGRMIGAFTEDRDAAIKGELGAKARMIPITISMDRTPGLGSGVGPVERKIEIADLPSLTPSAVLVSVYQTLLEANQSAASTSYHVTGEIEVHGMAPTPVDAWGTPGVVAPQLMAAAEVAEGFNRLYANATREAAIDSVHLRIEAIPQDLRVELESVRLVSSNIVHAGDTVVVEATVRPWEKPARNVRLGFIIPARLEPGSLRLLIGSALALDRTLEAARPANRPASLTVAADRLRGLHAADHLYVSMLLPESQASFEGRTLDSLPLSMANTLESQRSGVDVGLHGESVVMAGEAPVGGVLNGQEILTLRVEGGGGLH
jgi:SpoIVB peptidase S55